MKFIPVFIQTLGPRYIEIIFVILGKFIRIFLFDIKLKIFLKIDWALFMEIHGKTNKELRYRSTSMNCEANILTKVVVFKCFAC